MGFAQQLDDQDNYMLSRVAESLYWMSRYLERAENTARLIDVHQNLMLDSAPETSEKQLLIRLLRSIDYPMAALNIDEMSEEDILKKIAFDKDDPFSIHYSVTSARENARQIREQISTEMWMQINRLYLSIRQSDADAVWSDVPHNFFVSVKDGSHLFQGITDATMNHNQGWYFIQIGRYIERLGALMSFLNVQLRQSEVFTADIHQDNQYFELVALLKSISAFEAYCKVYNPEMRPDWIAEFLLFNPEFPRSARFCTDSILLGLERLAEKTFQARNQRVNRLAGRLQSSLNYDEIGEVLTGDFHDYLMNKREAYKIHDSLYNTYITYSIENTLR